VVQLPSDAADHVAVAGFLRNIQEGEQAIADPDQMHQGQPHSSRLLPSLAPPVQWRRYGGRRFF
jgi:hypothetical protein